MLLGCVSPCASLVKCESQQAFNIPCAEPTAAINLEPKVEIVKIPSVPSKSNSSFTSLGASASCSNQAMHLISPAEFQSENTQMFPVSSETIVREPKSAVEPENEFREVESEDEFSRVETEDVTLIDQVHCDVNNVSAPIELDNRDGEVLALPSSVSLNNSGSIDGDSNSEYYNCVSDTASTTSSNRLNVTIVRPQENPVQAQPEAKLQREMPDVYSNDSVSPVRTDEVSYFSYFKNCSSKSIFYFEIKGAKYKTNQIKSKPLKLPCLTYFSRFIDFFTFKYITLDVLKVYC